MEHGLAREVSHEEGPGAALSTEGPGAQVALLITVEDHSHMLQRDQFLSRYPAHQLNGVLVAQVIAALHRIEGVILPAIAPIHQRSIYTSLSGTGMAADGMHLCL